MVQVLEKLVEYNSSLVDSRGATVTVLQRGFPATIIANAFTAIDARFFPDRPKCVDAFSVIELPSVDVNRYEVRFYDILEREE